MFDTETSVYKLSMMARGTMLSDKYRQEARNRLNYLRSVREMSKPIKGIKARHKNKAYKPRAKNQCKTYLDYLKESDYKPQSIESFTRRYIRETTNTQ